MNSAPTVSVDGSTPFVGSNDKKMYALDAATGAEKWSYTTGAAVRSSPAVSSDGTAILGKEQREAYGSGG